MGNYVSSCSCSCACISSASSQRAVLAATERQRKLDKVIMVVHSVEERVMEMGGGAPMKVAELMLEFPGHFVVKCDVDISAMRCETGIPTQQPDVKRATPLPADHEALPGHIYILFPMHRLHTRVSPHESSSYKGLLSSYIAYSHLQLLNSCSKKKSLHSLMQASSSKVTPLSSLHPDEDGYEFPPHLSASHQLPADTDTEADAHIDDEIDLLLQRFCSPSSSVNHNNNDNSYMSRSGSLVRSKSWIPKLETISESSVLEV